MYVNNLPNSTVQQLELNPRSPIASPVRSDSGKQIKKGVLIAMGDCILLNFVTMKSYIVKRCLCFDVKISQRMTQLNS